MLSESISTEEPSAPTALTPGVPLGSIPEHVPEIARRFGNALAGLSRVYIARRNAVLPHTEYLGRLKWLPTIWKPLVCVITAVDSDFQGQVEYGFARSWVRDVRELEDVLSDGGADPRRKQYEGDGL